MPPFEPEEIPLKQSVLARYVYRREDALKRHLQKVLSASFDTIALFKFDGHEVDLDDAAANLEVLSSIFRWHYDQAGVTGSTPRLVRILYHDWFVELATALSAAGGVAGIVSVVHQILTARRLKRTTHSVQTSAVPAGGGQMRRVALSSSHVTEESEIGRFSIESVADHYQKSLEFIELYACHRQGGSSRNHRQGSI
jgi:hypothetical protein